jgi:starvation-inducible outer membrane lipoprotein
MASMKAMALTFALMLAGCAQTPPPPDVRSQGKRITGSSKLSPLQFSMCLSRNAESGGLMATTRPGRAVGYLEMLAFTLQEGGMNVIAATDIVPDGGGSTYTMFVTPKAEKPEGFAGVLAEDC